MADYFFGGLRLKQNKSGVLKLPTVACNYEGALSVVVSRQAAPLVADGATVKRDAPLAATDNAVWYCPCDGVLSGIEYCNHPLAGEVNLYKIIPSAADDGQMMLGGGSDADYPGMLIDTLDGRPLAEKLEEFKARGVKYLAVNAIDDQPYACSDTALVLEKHEEILQGLAIIAARAGLKPDGAVFFRTKAADGMAKLRREDITAVGGKYPYAYLYCRAHEKTTGFIGAQTCIDTLNASGSIRRQTEVVVTVSGDMCKNPRNLRVKLGTPISALLEQCGRAEDGIVVIGDGPMTGKYVSDLTTPVCFGMKSVLCLCRVGVSEISNCWGCAECAKVCPERLMPHYIARFARHGRFDDAAVFGADKCVGCGCCSYVCSGGVEPMSFILEAKAMLHSDLPEDEKRLPVVGLRISRRGSESREGDDEQA